MPARSTLVGTALAAALAAGSALAQPKPTEVDYFIPPLSNGNVNPNPFLASGVGIGRNVDVYFSAGIGPAARNTCSAAGTPERYIDYSFYPGFSCGSLPTGVTVTEAQGMNNLARIKENLEARGLTLEDVTYPPITVGDVDQRAGRVVLRDTKNRNDHKLLLSTQALEIAKRNCMGRKAEDPLFPVGDARKTLAWINKQAGTNVQGHGLRATFASIAEELVSSALLKRMMNHAAAGDVTLGHYVAKSEAQLRAEWQAVADFVEEAALRR